VQTVTTLVPLAWRGLLARRARTLLTVAGIALGVGMLYAALLTSAGIDQAVDRTVDGMIGRADLRVSAFQERGLATETVSAIRTAPGVAVAAPVLEQRLYLRRAAGVAATAPVLLRGIDPELDAQVHDLPLLSGTGLVGAAGPSALVTRRLALEDGIAIGDSLVLQAGGVPVRVQVVGTVSEDEAGFGGAGRGVIVPLDVARSVYPVAGLSRVDIRLDPGSSAADVASALAGRISADPYVLSAPADLRASMRAATGDFQAILAMIAAIALFAGSVLVFNTLSLTVVERAREVGLLRAAGATTGQVLAFVLAGAATLGLAGSLLGLVIGALLSLLAGAGIEASGIAPWDQPPLTASTAALAFFAGIVVALAAALEPAWRATRISPVEAVRLRVDPASARQARLRWMVVVSLTVGLLGLLAWPQSAGESAGLRALAIYGLLVLAILLSPLFVGPLARIVGLPFTVVARLDERLARGSLARDRSRTALTLGALAVGLAMIVAVGGVAQQARAAANAWLSGVIPGDEVVTSIRPVAADEGVVERLDELPGVARVTPVGSFDLAWRGTRLDAAAVDGASLLADGRLAFTAGDRNEALLALDDGGAVILARAMAERLGLGLGATMTLLASGGSMVDLTVVGVVDRSLPGRTGEALLVGWKDATRSLGVAGADFFAVRFEPDQAAAARFSVEETARSLALEAAPLDAVEGAVGAALGRVFGLFDALALIAVLIAALGIVNTLTMSVVERVRELGILRAAGMSARQVGRMVVVEAGILGLVGGVVGVTAGSIAGFLMVGWGSGYRGDWAPAWSLIAVALLLGLVVSMLAAWYPARLAGRISIVRAVQFE
jgi:putative ABC transport system permease protein